MSELIQGVLFFALGYAAVRCALAAWTIYKMPPWEWKKLRGHKR